MVFAELAMKRPHLLVMDEPTNNLDIESIDALIEAVKEFCGGVVLVSHDARLILEAECELWVCGNQDVYAFDGDFDDYKEMVLEEVERLAATGISALAAQQQQKLAAEAKASGKK